MTTVPALVNPADLVRLYGEVPPLGTFRPRSLNLSWRGPTVTLRVDLSTFPATVPPEWEGADADTVQCHLQFIAVEDFVLEEWEPPVPFASFTAEPLGRDRRMRVRVRGAGVDLGFTGHESVHVGHVSAFRIASDGTDGGRHLFQRPLGRRLHETVPGPEEKTFHERV
ncbi:Imm50 family immunity protein [Streptomyces sp. NPDC088752]|uniref:Imm50 family immunity protein n=1 Tax=Streptomyces sp. NPDC088752 TaxID=3154963 RepID=UPI0034376B65